MTDAKRNAETYLETCALGYAAAVQTRSALTCDLCCIPGATAATGRCSHGYLYRSVVREPASPAAVIENAANVERLHHLAGSRAALHDAGVRLAAALGNLDAAERAEFEALRRFRDGVVAMRSEVAVGRTDAGEPLTFELVVETIDALLFFASPAKETPCPGS